MKWWTHSIIFLLHKSFSDDLLLKVNCFISCLHFIYWAFKSFILNLKVLCESQPSFKDRGGLVRPIKEVMYVVNVTDTVLSQLMEKCNIIAEKNVIKKVFFGVSKVLALKQPDFLKELCKHNANTDEISSHKTRMIEKIVSCYATLRLKHYCKLKTTTFHRKKIRRYFNKLILFKNQ